MNINTLNTLGLDTIDEKFIILEPVSGGQGSRGFFGQNIATGEAVFIKLLLFPRSLTEVSRFKHEIHALEWFAKLPSSPVPKIIAHGELHDGEILYLITEKIEGELLSNWILDKAQESTPDQKLEIFHRVTSALASCTFFDHMDLHPGNIILTNNDPNWVTPGVPESAVTILDWGQCYNPRMVGYEDTPDFITHLNDRIPKELTGSFYSTPPEVFQPWENTLYNPTKYDAWSLGLLFFKIMTQRDLLSFSGIGNFVESLYSGKLQKTIQQGALELEDLFSQKNLLIHLLFYKLTKVNPSARIGAGEASRILWDMRIEDFSPKNLSEALTYIKNPFDFRPPGGWTHSDWPDYD